MEVDVFVTGVTGFVGRFVLHQLLESATTLRIAVLIRASGKQSALQRFQEEIVGSTLFAGFAEQLQSVQVIDASLETLEHTTLRISKATRIIHCAANVKHYDPYEALERDNVQNVQRILRVAELLTCESLVLLSTCYVHPRDATQRPPIRIQAPRDQFYNDYCYTKWLGEESVLNAKTRIPSILILRLSCVGAPVRRDLAAHPCVAQAHLGIASLALRGYLEGLTYRPGARISTIPVDVAAAAIVAERTQEGIHIEQLCAPTSLTEYHLPLSKVVAILRDSYGLESFRGLPREDTSELALPLWKQAAYWLFAKGRKSLELHENVQDFVATFTDTDIRFESSLDSAAFPTKTEEELIHATCKYAIGGLHARQLAKGIPMTLSDRFWHRLANGEHVQACVGVKIPLSEWPKVRQRLWEFFITERKYTSEPDENRWKQVSGHCVDSYVAPPQPSLDTEGVLAYGLQHPPKRSWFLTPFLGSEESESIDKILLSFDHGLTDGVGLLSRFPDLLEHLTGTPYTPGPQPPRKLPFWLDLWMGLVYLILLITILWMPTQTEPYSREPSIATASFAYHRPAKPHTPTTQLLWNLTQWLGSTGQPDHLLVVPALTELYRSPAEMSKNAFAPLLLPVSSNMSESSFLRRCSLLHSKSVRFLSWCLQHLIEWGSWDELRDLYIQRVSCVVSSMQIGSLPESMTFHACTTTPAPIPYSIVCFSNQDRMMLSVRSHRSNRDAHQLLAALQPKK